MSQSATSRVIKCEDEIVFAVDKEKRNDQMSEILSESYTVEDRRIWSEVLSDS